MPDSSRLSAFLRRLAALLGAYWLVSTASLMAQPVLVKDINTLTNPGDLPRFEPAGLTRVGNQVFFVAGTLAHGYELWRSDGNAAGTGLLKDIYPGFQNAYIQHLTAAGNTLFFLANDGVHGYELWKSDGTGAGTRLVKDIAPGAGSINIIQMMSVQNTAYFLIALSKYAYQLWRSDGTPGGTILLRQFIPHPESLDGPRLYASLGNRLYFAAYTTASGRELWRTDGTPAGTVMVKDAAPGSYSSRFETGSFAALNGRLYYLSSTDLQHEPQFCLTDGTAAGTTRLRDTNPQVVMPALAMVRSVTRVGNRLFFTSYDATHGEELWVTDGTAAGTRLVKDIAPGYWPSNSTLPNSSVPGNLFNGDGLLYFLAYGEGIGRELYRSDGTAAGTFLVKDLPGRGNYYGNFRMVNGTFYFTGNSDVWQTRGTPASTVLSQPLRAEAGAAFPQYYTQYESLTEVENALFFAYDNNFWRGDGTAAGTFPLTNAQDPSNFGAEPSALARAGNALYFWAHDDATSWEIWKSDGTQAGTRKVKEINPGPASAWSPEAPLTHRVVVPLQSTAYFTATDGVNGTELWKSDGTETGTVMVKDIRPGAGSSMPHNLTVRDGVLYFAANDGVNGTELWRSDGTAAGTRLVRNIRASAGSGLGDYDAYLTVANGTLYFAASDGTTGNELWKSDGTEAGTGRVKDLVPGTGSSSPQNLVPVNGTLFFTASNGTGGYDLWKSDGTGGGTVRVKDPVPDQYNNPPYQLTDVNGTLYFALEHPSRTYTLWESDGTEAGTLPLKTFTNVNGYDPPLQHLTNLNGTLYFTARDPQKGYELWKSNGTAAGTGVVVDLTPGIEAGGTGSPAGTPFSQLVNVNGTLYFGARGLYRSDGTAAGTVCVSNLYPEWPEIADLKHLTMWNGTLYFTASSVTRGNELWKYDPVGCVTPNAGLAVATDPVCLGNEAVVRVTGSQPGVRYQLSLNGSLLGQPVPGGGDIALVVPPVSLAPGAYTFAVRAVGCTEVTLTQRAVVTVSEVTAPTVTGITIVSGGLATLTAGGAPAGSTYRWYDGPLGGAPLREGPSFTTPVLTATRVYYASIYQPGCGESMRTPLTVTVTPSPAASSYRINAGGNVHTTADGRAFSADAYFTDGVASAPVTGEVAGTMEDVLYRTGRHGTTFTYALPVAPGDYRVVLHFNETYWGNGRSGGVGSRKFNVDLEGVRRLTEYDIFATAGGAMRAVQESFTVRVTDGQLDVRFGKGTADNPRVSAIEVTSVAPALRVNAGGDAYTTADAKTFAADGYFTGGSNSAITGGDVGGTADDYLYRNLRFGASFTYTFPVPNGTYDVVLHFNETYFGYRTAGGVGSRRFHVDIEGSRRLSDYDITAAAGSAMRAKTETFRVQVADGAVTVLFSKGPADNPAVAALEVVPVAPAARLTSGSGAGEPSAVLYPNPVGSTLTVMLDTPAAEVLATSVTDATGTLRLSHAHRPAGTHGLTLDVRTLPPGLYVLRLHTAARQQVLKFVKR